MVGAGAEGPGSLPGLAGLDLAKTLDCGQAFRWRQEGGLWTGSACGRALSVSQDDLAPLAADPFWARYFDLGFDYQGAEAELERVSPAMAQAVAFSKGIRILRQDPWETLASFIVSQNNNIKRIKLTIGRLVQAAGGRFPSPDDILRLAADGRLGALGLGYRDAYILDAAAQVAGGALDLKALEGLPSDAAALRLKAVKGVGEKVASCVLLFGYHRLERFPRDVWIKRVMADLFDGRSGERLFGPLAGLAQQHLFYWGRERYYAGSRGSEGRRPSRR